MSTLVVGTVKSTGAGQPVFKNSSNTVVGTLVQVWVNFAGGRSGLTAFGIRASSGVSSVVDNGTGDYTVNFSTAFADAGSYSCTADAREDDNGGQGDHGVYFQRTLSYTQSSSIRLRTGTSSAYSDNDQIWVTCVGTTT
jgi:hypothetical protein